MKASPRATQPAQWSARTLAPRASTAIRRRRTTTTSSASGVSNWRRHSASCYRHSGKGRGRTTYGAARRLLRHKQPTLDWLNQITDESFRFFGLEVEFWRIGNSPAAPKFNIVSKPNDWSQSVACSALARYRRCRTIRDADHAARLLGGVQAVLNRHWLGRPR